MSVAEDLAAVAAVPEADTVASVDAAITSRRSVRAFLPTPVPAAMVRHLLEVSSRAPSGTNMQPWKAYVLGGARKQALSDAILKAFREEQGQHKAEYEYYPAEFPEPYKTRRRTVGFGLYNAVGIARDDMEGRARQSARNYVFFDAPVGIIFTIDKVLERGSWIDYGMFLENICIAARGHGLHTCAQAAFAHYHRVIRRELDIPDEEVVVCGMSIGYEDKAAPENALRTDRAGVEEFARFLGFDD